MKPINLSIITITYNNPDLKRTLDSVLAQKNVRDQIEHIIVDNLSSDNTKEIISAYSKKAPYKVIHIREKDDGRYDAMNKGIKAAKGTYLSFMNAGDHFFKNNSIEEILNHASNHDIIYGNLNVVDAGFESVYFPPDSIDFKYFLSFALPHQASIIKKELFEKVGYYDSSLKIASDWKFYLLAICKFKCSYYHLNKTIATYYFDGISSRPESAKLNNEEKNKILNEHFSQLATKKITGNINSSEKRFTVPIYFSIFNRPDVTQKVFNEIRKIKPTQLFVSADGPREGKEGELEKCQKTRGVIEQVDWECEVKVLFRDTNFGCGNAMNRGISWFFENVEEGIILEDDCLPDQSFFTYCAELLEKYRHNVKISHINGTSFVLKENTKDSYYFSKFYHVWGWATWRRAWNLYDFSMKTFPQFKASGQIKTIFSDKNIQKFWLGAFNEVYAGKLDTWDYQWVYANLSHKGLSVMPFINMITNVGFGEDATHTTSDNNKNSDRHSSKMGKISHPTSILSNQHLDNIIYNSSLGISLTSFDKQVHASPIHFLVEKITRKSSNILLNSIFRKPLLSVYYFLKAKKLIK